MSSVFSFDPMGSQTSYSLDPFLPKEDPAMVHRHVYHMIVFVGHRLF